jgi:hypothetical protein
LLMLKLLFKAENVQITIYWSNSGGTDRNRR